MVVNKYIRCVAACLGVACGCICADADAMGSTAGGAGGKDQVINPTGGTDQIKQTQKVRYKFNVKSDMDQCTNVGEIYVKEDKTTGKVEKGILLYKGKCKDENGKETEKELFYVKGELTGKADGYYLSKFAGVDMNSPISWETNNFQTVKFFVRQKKGVGKKINVTSETKECFRKFVDVVGSSGIDIYGGIFKSITDKLSEQSVGGGTRPIGEIDMSFLGNVNFNNNTENGKTEGNNGKKGENNKK